MHSFSMTFFNLKMSFHFVSFLVSLFLDLPVPGSIIRMRTHSVYACIRILCATCFTELFQNFWRIYISRISNDMNIQARFTRQLEGQITGVTGGGGGWFRGIQSNPLIFLRHVGTTTCGAGAVPAPWHSSCTYNIRASY